MLSKPRSHLGPQQHSIQLCNKPGMPQLDQLYGTYRLAVGTERAARRGNVRVPGGEPSGPPGTLLLCFFLVTLSRTPISATKLPVHRSRDAKTARRMILAKSSQTNLLHILSRRTGSGAPKVPPAKVTGLRSVGSRNFRNFDPEKWPETDPKRPAESSKFPHKRQHPIWMPVFLTHSAFESSSTWNGTHSAGSATLSERHAAQPVGCREHGSKLHSRQGTPAGVVTRGHRQASWWPVVHGRPTSLRARARPPWNNACSPRPRALAEACDAPLREIVRRQHNTRSSEQGAVRSTPGALCSTRGAPHRLPMMREFPPSPSGESLLVENFGLLFRASWIQAPHAKPLGV